MFVELFEATSFPIFAFVSNAQPADDWPKLTQEADNCNVDVRSSKLSFHPTSDFEVLAELKSQRFTVLMRIGNKAHSLAPISLSQALEIPTGIFCKLLGKGDDMRQSMWISELAGIVNRYSTLTLPRTKCI